MADQVGHRGLSVGAGNADKLQFPFGMAVPGRRHTGQRFTGIGHLNAGHVIGQRLGHILHQQGAGTLLQRLWDIGMAVTLKAFDGNEQTAGRDLPRVITDSGNFLSGRAGQARGNDLPQQIL